MKTNYQQQAEGILKEIDVEFKAEFVDKSCPMWCDDEKHMHGWRYKITFSRGGRSIHLFFWNSYSDVTYAPKTVYEKQQFDIYGITKGWRPKTPTAYDVLACITKSSPGLFFDFCDEFGYDSDSRKAEQTYDAVLDEYFNLKKLFTDDELERLQEVN